MLLSYNSFGQIDAVNDSGATINGYTGGISLSNVLINDTLNGNPVDFSTINLVVVSTSNSGVILNVSNGSVVVNAGTPAGNYAVTYQICEIGNPSNCDIATVTIAVSAAPINAIDDVLTANNLLYGFPLLNVLNNDTFNGSQLIPSLITTTMVSATNPGITLSGSSIVVAPGTPMGTYFLTYQICEVLNPTNCDTAVVQVTTTSPVLTAGNDVFHIASSSPTNPLQLGSVTFNDELNGAVVPLSYSNVTPSTNGPLSIDQDGILTLATGTPMGVYTLVYTICEADPITGLNVVPPNCDTATITVTVGNVINAVNNTFLFNTNNSSGNVLTNDTINNVSFTATDVNLTVLSSSNPNITIDQNGNIVVSLGVPNGSYTLSYQICEVINPDNCDTATVTVSINFTGLTVVTTSTYVDNNADGFTNVGDTITYEFVVNNNHPYIPITNISFTSQNVSISGGPIVSLPPSTSDATTFTGVRVLTQQDINNGSFVFTGYVSGTLNVSTTSFNPFQTKPLNQSNGIRMIAFVDANGNGSLDSNESNFYSGSFNYQIDGGAIQNVNSNLASVYLYESNPMVSYNLGYTINPAYDLQYTVSTPNYTNVTVSNGSGITTYYFAIEQLPFTDLAVNISSLVVPPRPGFTYENRIVIQNQGNQTIPSGTLTFTNDPTVSIVLVSPSGSVAVPTGFTYNFTNLLPTATIQIIVVMQVPTIPTVSLGQQLTNTASVTIPIEDINVTNNSSSITQVIVGSYDPNDKQEHHGGQIQFDSFTSNDYLRYTIRFENTGTANAINVSVEDVLNAQLDETSIRMVDASHNYVLERVGSNVTWKFSGIDLPPSVPDTQIGHGYVTFQIKPKTGFAIGDIIENTAEIYFDFNPAIITNTHTTEFVETLGNASLAFSNLNYFPNPVKNSLTITNNSLIDSIEVSSILGQLIYTQKVNNLETEIDMSTLSKGIYFAKVVSDGAEKIIKVIKE